MAMDSKIKRDSTGDIRTDRNKLKKEGDSIRRTGEKLAADKETVGEIKEFIESSNIPDSGKEITLGLLELQEQVIEAKFETDVERPQEALEKKQENYPARLANMPTTRPRIKKSLQSLRDPMWTIAR